uniref:Rubisco LSMT substrate-binding domain-containing protein n=1 Tax=Tetradesmus obliquus TaxID=3088 RepID=A0A383VYM3_TETOB|eukprot:jgi/Sobl393_1/18934/SZX69932.1
MPGAVHDVREEAVVPEKLVVTLDRIFESEGLAEMLTAGKLSELACLALYMMYEKKVFCALSAVVLTAVVPEKLAVTLDRIFESEGLAEMLTAGKLSELACLALYMMYEKKVGKEGFWHQYIKELDRQRARGVQAVESPLLWSDEELTDLLQGSPVVAAVRARLAGIEKEYNELDGVWFMAGSLFNKYPFDIPTEAFPFVRFKQAFAAVQASIVHLQGVALARRFALVPLGPPLLSYSSTAKATFKYNPENKCVELVVDRDYQPGEPLYAWCGPQPNSRLLLNYGIVDESNPYDKLPLVVTLPANDPLYKVKRGILQEENLSTLQTFDMKRGQPLPPLLLPYLRLAFATTHEQLDKVVFSEGAAAFDPQLEQIAACHLAAHLNERMAGYKHPLWRDLEILEDPEASPRQKVAARLTKIEKSILQGCLDAVGTCAPCLDAANSPKTSLAVKFSG